MLEGWEHRATETSVPASEILSAFSWDALGRRLSVTEGAGTADARSTTYSYDGLGRRTAQVVAAGALTALVGLAPLVRFLWFYARGDGDGHVQSLVIGGALLVVLVIGAAVLLVRRRQRR